MPAVYTCSAPLCPLDPGIELRCAVDGEDECKATRATREAIARKYPEMVPANGLKPRELRADKRRAAFLALPVEEQEWRRAILAQGRAPKFVKLPASKVPDPSI